MKYTQKSFQVPIQVNISDEEWAEIFRPKSEEVHPHKDCVVCEKPIMLVNGFAPAICPSCFKRAKRKSHSLLTKKEIDGLVASGMFYELYPEGQ